MSTSFIIAIIVLYVFNSHDHHGRLTRVNWSHFARDSHLDCDLDTVEELYKVTSRE